MEWQAARRPVSRSRGFDGYGWPGFARALFLRSPPPQPLNSGVFTGIASPRGNHLKRGSLDIGIIGYGRFGRFAAEILKPHARVRVYDRHLHGRQRGIHGSSLQEVVQVPILILCVPISKIESICLELSPYLKPGQLVLDTCSVKKQPLAQMLRLLPKTVEVLGTHPLFGPDSAKAGIQGHRIALCPGRGRRLNKVKKFLQQLGLKVIVTSAAIHDQEMARTQALFHFLARGVAALKIAPGQLATPGPAKLFRDFQDVQNDSLQLFQDLESANPYAPPLRRRLLGSLTRVDQQLRKSPHKK